MHLCKDRLGCSGENISSYSIDKNLEFEICNDCGIIWRSNASRNITRNYEQNYFDSKNYSKKRKHKVNKSGWLIDLARSQTKGIKSILEIGCSIGYTLEAAKNRNINHFGIDISSYAVEFCTNLGLNAEQVTFDQLIKRGEKFDLVYMQHVLEHFEDPFLTLQNCNNLLNDNGLILILVPNSKYNPAVKKNYKHRFYSFEGVGAEHFVYFNYTNLVAALRASGFKLIQANYPIFQRKYDSVEFFANRIFRRLLSVFKYDQELLVIAQKNTN